MARKPCGASPPSLVGADRIEILDGHLGTRTLRGTFRYEPSWRVASPLIGGQKR